MHPLAGIFSLLTGIAGWFYLFHSRAATALADVEAEALNRQRIRLRRVGGIVMLAIAVLFYLGSYAVDADRRPTAFVGLWLAVFVLLLFMLGLALGDVRLTWRIRRQRQRRP